MSTTRVPVAEPLASVMVFLLRVKLSTAIVGAFTVTAHVAVLFPSDVVAVIVAVPSPIAFTVTDNPVPLTVATLLLLVVHVMALFVAVAGAMVAVKLPVVVPPIARVIVVGLSVTPVTATVVGVLVPPSLPPPLQDRKANAVRHRPENSAVAFVRRVLGVMGSSGGNGE